MGTEDEMAGWHPQLNGHEFEQTLGDSNGQGSLACCNPWGHKELDTTQRLNNKNDCQRFGQREGNLNKWNPGHFGDHETILYDSGFMSLCICQNPYN